MVFMETSKPKLAVHEWMAVVTIFGFLFILTIISNASYHDPDSIPKGSPHYLKAQELEVVIEGAVQNPGTYKVKTGTTRQDILDLAKPTPEANLKRFNGTAKVRNGLVIQVPAKDMIDITVTGAVKSPGVHSVPRGTRLEELTGYIELNDDADPDSLNKKRYIKANEKIHVPARKGH